MIEHFRNVLFVGAHPDDEVACAGTLTKIALGTAHIDAVAFTDCADTAGLKSGPWQLDDEYAEAWRGLGVTPWGLGRHDNQRLSEVRQHILQFLYDQRNAGYDLVLVPASTDIHQDHTVVREEAIRAFKNTTILGYEHPQNTIRAGVFNAYVELTEDDVAAKLEHAAIYKTQAKRPYMQPDFIRSLATVRGLQIGKPYAEAFEVIRWVM